MSSEQAALTTREAEVLDDNESIPVPSGGIGMTGLARAEVDVQIQTAKKYPRSIRDAVNYALQLATFDMETAESCYYSFKRGGNEIEGPSIRLAEIIASAWGNLRYGAELLGADDSFIRARGYCSDLQTNTAFAGEVERRITDSKGRRYNDDMIAVTGMAAAAIAARNAVFRIVPRAYVNKVLAEAQKVAVGDAKSLSNRWQTVVAKYAKRGVVEAQLYAKFGIKGAEEVTLDHIKDLIGLATAIHEGRTTLEKEFPPIAAAPAASAPAPAAGPVKSPVEQLNEVAKKAAGKAKQPPPEPEEPPENSERIDPTAEPKK